MSSDTPLAHLDSAHPAWRGGVVICHLGAARDAAGVDLRPAAAVIHRGRLVQLGRPGQVAVADYPQAVHVSLPDTLLLPRMANAHVHLDMTSAGRWPYGGDFPTWLGQVMTRCADASTAPSSVAAGWSAGWSAGVAVVGDIARFASSVAALADAAGPLAGVSFLERFGQGRRQPEAVVAMRREAEALVALHERTGLPVGLQPHAPYSAGLEMYAAAASLADRLPLRLATHLAESLEEDRFIRQGDGPMADLLARLGKWDDAILGHGVSPVAWLSPVTQRSRWLAAHVNYATDDDIAQLAAHGVSVAYCPVASAYFGHQGHRYRAMLDAGVNVCLGTDSIVCQPVDEPQPLGLWPQMRLLFERDGCDPSLLLAMATVHGARALGVDEALVTLALDRPASFMAVRFDPALAEDPLAQALGRRDPLVTLEQRLASLWPAKEG